MKVISWWRAITRTTHTLKEIYLQDRIELAGIRNLTSCRTTTLPVSAFINELNQNLPLHSPLRVHKEY
jgi:hypothetical protein